MEKDKIIGLDYSYGRPGGKLLVDKEISFVARYLSVNPLKNITTSEILDLKLFGIDIVLIWESTARRPMAGFNGGISDAKRALTLATKLGFSDNKVLYFACDDDFRVSEQPIINQYFSGISSVLNKNQIGAYGGYWVIKRLFDQKLINYGWQTTAWSGGNWDPRIHIKQVLYNQQFGNASCDVNYAVKDDYGQN